MPSGNEVEILLVEDNPNDVELTLRALKKQNLGNRVVVARDGEEATDYLFNQGVLNGKTIETIPRLILLDLKLPKIDGKEVLKMLKNDDRTKLIPVVVLTSSKEERDIFESYKLGANSYIVKPVDFDKFVEAVKSLGFYWLLLNQAPRVH